MSPSGLRGRVAATPLRVKLVAALIGLLVLGLAITGFAAYTTMRNYLVGQIDRQLTANAPQVAGRVLRDAQGADLSTAQCGNDPRDGPTSFYFQVSNGTGTLGCAPDDGSARGQPAFPKLSAAQISSRHGEPFTVGS
ncbi:MAG: hypothetical protein ACXV2H_12700, partial [Actinomycetes bacterium]